MNEENVNVYRVLKVSNMAECGQVETKADNHDVVPPCCDSQAGCTVAQPQTNKYYCNPLNMNKAAPVFPKFCDAEITSNKIVKPNEAKRYDS